MNRLVVSLTSYGDRIETTLPKTLKSIENCTSYSPDMIVLYLAEQDRPRIKNQFVKYKHLSIRYVNDYMSHKKFIALTEKEFIDDYIVIIDDDLLYKPYFFEKLYDKFFEHQNESNFIVCNRAQKLLDREYSRKPFIMKGDPDYGKMVFGSGAGLLIPPHTMRFDLPIIEEGFKVAPHCDETFYSAYCIKKNIRTFCTGKPQPFQPQVLPKGNVGLWEKYNKREKDITFHSVFRYFRLEINEKIFVSFTSWRDRIHLASKVVQMMRNQTLPPEKIILTLSSDEFPYKEEELPKDLVSMVGDDFCIRWTDRNTKTFKKLEPLFYIHPECWVLLVDDDVEYPRDFIETMYCSTTDDRPVTGSGLKTDYREYGYTISCNGAFCLIKPKHCLPHLKELKDYLIEYTEDIPSDPVLTYSVFYNDIEFIRSTTDYQRLQNRGVGKYPSPYSEGSTEHNDYIHDLIHRR